MNFNVNALANSLQGNENTQRFFGPNRIRNHGPQYYMILGHNVPTVDQINISLLTAAKFLHIRPLGTRAYIHLSSNPLAFLSIDLVDKNVERSPNFNHIEIFHESAPREEYSPDQIWNNLCRWYNEIPQNDVPMTQERFTQEKEPMFNAIFDIIADQIRQFHGIKIESSRPNIYIYLHVSDVIALEFCRKNQLPMLCTLPSVELNNDTLSRFGENSLFHTLNQKQRDFLLVNADIFWIINAYAFNNSKIPNRIHTPAGMPRAHELFCSSDFQHHMLAKMDDFRRNERIVPRSAQYFYGFFGITYESDTVADLNRDWLNV